VTLPDLCVAFVLHSLAAYSNSENCLRQDELMA